MSQASVRVVLDLEVAADTVKGSICAPGQPREPFYGWLELAGRLKRACEDESLRTEGMSSIVSCD